MKATRFYYFYLEQSYKAAVTVCSASKTIDLHKTSNNSYPFPGTQKMPDSVYCRGYRIAFNLY